MFVQLNNMYLLLLNARMRSFCIVGALVALPIACLSLAHDRTRTSRTNSLIALGAYIGDQRQGSPTNSSVIDHFARITGRKPAIVMWYQKWGESSSSFPIRPMNTVRGYGAVPLLTWEPWRGVDKDPAYKLRAITRGDFDPYIRRWATDAAAWGYPFYLRFAHEMNGAWYPWGVGANNANGNTAADYIAAWRHVHDIFAQTGARNVLWVWSPNVSSLPNQFATMYPGDDYVDCVGLDGYNSGTSWPGSHWQSLLDLFGPSYRMLAAITNKPVMISEIGSTEFGGNKAAWIAHGLLADVPAYLPHIRAVVWFDKNKETDWRVNSSPDALRAYRAVVASPLYQGYPPTMLVDNLDNWSKTYSHTGDLHFDSSDTRYFGGDTARIKRSTPTSGEVIWYQPRIRQFQMDAYFTPNQAISAFALYISRDGVSWQSAVSPRVLESHEPVVWTRYTYSLDVVPTNVNYVMVRWTSTTAPYWSPQVGRVIIHSY